MKNVSCEYDWLNGWNSTLQATWYIGQVRWACLFYKIILRSIEKRLLWARPIGGWNTSLRAAYSIIHLYRAHARSFSPFLSAQTFAPILYVRTRIAAWWAPTSTGAAGAAVPIESYHTTLRPSWLQLLLLIVDQLVYRAVFLLRHIYHPAHVFYFIKSWKTSAVSTTMWMVETQLCKLRGTSDIFI